uniref:ShKT domain-containing protein n=1 Tax=Globodera rostochiensis TaxID=31243 RepID=A0A914HLP2_GLORO
MRKIEQLFLSFSIFAKIFAIAFGQENCAEAPNAALQKVCEQLYRWDKKAREAPPVEESIVLPPAIPGLETPLFAAELAPIATTPYQCMDLGCLCSYMGGSGQQGSNACRLPNGRPLNKALRREYRMLSDEERARFHSALLAIKQSGEYDRMAALHAQFATSGSAHSGPGFLPWHREFTKRVEIALRQVDPTVAIPYWDSTLESALPTPSDSHLFTAEFMGTTDSSGNLITGDFAGWRTLDGRPNVMRSVGTDGTAFREQDLQWFLDQNSIEMILGFTAPRQGCQDRSSWNLMEYTHGNVHVFIGGDMTDQSTSANDPIFFIHHSFVDLIWETWRQTKQTRSDRETIYPLDMQLCSAPQHFGSGLMRPFQPWRNTDGLNNKYTDNLYEYAPRPSCRDGSNCGSKYLFCDRSHGNSRCAAKVRQGGNCLGFSNGEDVCLNGQCQGGRCVQTNRPSPSPSPPPPVAVQTQTVPARPRPTTQISCFNEHECCEVWSRKGECQRNPTYMNAWCKASCRQCRVDYDMFIECNDRHVNCAQWAKRGECTRNRFWMAENCRQSCDKCQVTRAQVCSGGSESRTNQHRITAPTPRKSRCSSTGCFNENICCQFWGLMGECRKNSAWMTCNCRVSCGACIPQGYDFGSCSDYHPECRQWAIRGECRRNAWMLENCKRSCESCVSFRELRQICRGRRAGGPVKRRRARTFGKFYYDDGSVHAEQFEDAGALRFDTKTSTSSPTSSMLLRHVRNVQTKVTPNGTAEKIGPPSHMRTIIERIWATGHKFPKMWLHSLCLLLFALFPIQNAQKSCATAPTSALRTLCEQLHRWDTNARAAPPVEDKIPLPPAIAGLPAPTLAAELAPIATTPYQCMDLPCLSSYLGGKQANKAIRKEYRMLSDMERSRFHAAMKTIKKNGEYDKIARIHADPTIGGGAHGGPAFLPWHREYIKRLEISLRQVDPSVALPYWDSTLEDHLPTPKDSHLFTTDFMGETDAAGNLVKGDFAGWQTTTGKANVLRKLGTDGHGFRETEINWFLQQTTPEMIFGYSAPQQGCTVTTNYNLIEYTHGNIHLFIGGDMAEQSTAANDPIFFLLHSFVDFIWEMKRQRQGQFERESLYPMDNAQCASALHFGSALMRPFQPWQNRDGMSNKYTDNLYEYAPRPSCQSGPNCGSKYLFCDRSHGTPRCAAQVKPGGNCTGFNNGEDVCLNGECRANKCVQTEKAKPTPKPPPSGSTGSPLKPVHVACYNEHECCATWANKGECQRNPSYMNAWCKASCKQCQPDYSMATECADRHKNCGRWNGQGECNKNLFWMTENCRKSCSKCGVARSQVCGGGAGSKTNQNRVTKPPPKQAKCTSPMCFNENLCCQLWGLMGECRKNSAWMTCNCRVSCGACIPQNYAFGACADYHPQCGQWAGRGECQKNGWMLENCKRSCDTCVSFWELRQSCRGRQSGGRRRRSTAAPAIEFNDDFEPIGLLRMVREAAINESSTAIPLKGISVVGGDSGGKIKNLFGGDVGPAKPPAKEASLKVHGQDELEKSGNKSSSAAIDKSELSPPASTENSEKSEKAKESDNKNDDGKKPNLEEKASNRNDSTTTTGDGSEKTLGKTPPPDLAGDLASSGGTTNSSGPVPPPKNTASGEDPCAKAPTKSLRIVCQQLHRWDKNAREAPPVEEAVPKMPSIPGLDMGLLAAELAPIAASPYQCMDLGCLCKYMNGNGQEGSNNCQLSDNKPLKKAIRKEYRMLSDQERAKFHAAMNAIKKSGEYDKIAALHAAFGQSGAAHAGPAFLPWHRELMKRLEISLRQMDPSVSVPYWDSSLEAQLPTPGDSHMFTKDFMGDTDSQGNLVVGDFAGWKTLTGTPNVIRHVGQGGKGFTENEIQWFLNQRQLDKVFGYSSPQPGLCPMELDYQLIEVTHGNVHLFVGGEEAQPAGHMSDTSTSANDPLFFLHHAFVDCIWEQWRQSKQNRNDREIAYPMDNAQCASAMHFGSAPMRPFQPWRNVDGLSNKYTDNMFEYGPRPNCQMGPNCGSKYLFCDRSHGPPHCAAKVRTRGNCQGFSNDEEVCYNGICQRGRCVDTNMEPPTTRPPPPTTFQPPKQSQVACYNEHECCSLWADKGECERNSGYMSSWCKASCRQCQVDYDMNQECTNRHPNCGQWSNEGQCQRNQFWMTENCRQACGKCQVTRWQVCNGGAKSQQNQNRITQAPPAQQAPQCSSKGCYNENICCQLWGLAGECRRNPPWMNCFCKVSCGKCIPQDYVFGSCTDYHPRCWQWADAGECRRNAWMLENCKQSCSTCVSQSELRQMCRRGGRGKREIGMMPSIEYSMQALSRFSRDIDENEEASAPAVAESLPSPHGPPEKATEGAKEFVSGQKKMPDNRCEGTVCSNCKSCTFKRTRVTIIAFLHRIRPLFKAGIAFKLIINNITLMHFGDL